MIALLMTAAAWSLTTVEIQLAPDQALPYVYVDEPLVIEFLADEDVLVAPRLTIECPSQTPVIVTMNKIQLRTGKARWEAVPALPTDRGRYTIHIEISETDPPMTISKTVCRIDRPFAGSVSALVLDVSRFSPTATHLASAASLNTLALDGSAENFPGQAAEATQAGYTIIARGQSVTDMAAVARWELDGSAPPAQIAKQREGLRQEGSRALMSVAIDEPATVTQLLTSGLGAIATQWVISDPKTELAAYRLASEKSGYENFRWYSALSADSPATGPAIFEQIASALSRGARQVRIDQSQLTHEGELTAAFPAICAYGPLMEGASPIGRLNLDTAACYVFRRGRAWIAIVCPRDATTTTTLPLGAAATLSAFDVFNNPLPLPPFETGSITLPPSDQPYIITGEGGSLLLQSAQSQAQEESAKLLAMAITTSHMTPAAIQALKMISSGGDTTIGRREFLVLLQQFPPLEEAWCSGTIARRDAIPLIASLARLMQHLSTVEQEIGETFLDPLQDRLARCQELQALYITGLTSATTSHERGDGLLAAITRLTTQAVTLESEGRSTEAAGVAALAEWRARSLKYAATAPPLSQPEPEKPTPAEQTIATEEASE
jgi:hypothetical protein